VIGVVLLSDVGQADANWGISRDASHVLLQTNKCLKYPMHCCMYAAAVSNSCLQSMKSYFCRRQQNLERDSAIRIILSSYLLTLEIVRNIKHRSLSALP
jgi:hypothetical protein